MNPSQQWWQSHSNAKSLYAALQTPTAKVVPLPIRRLLHFDSETAAYAKDPTRILESHIRLPSMSLQEVKESKIPTRLQHLLNLAWHQAFQAAEKICQERMTYNKDIYEKLVDTIDTSRIQLSEEDLKTKAREHLGTGTNAVATKKYMDWVANHSKHAQTIRNHARSFWLSHRHSPAVWEQLWNNPLLGQVEGLAVPPDLTHALVRAKLSGALELFPKSGMYVGEWSLSKDTKVTTDTQDWQLGVFTLIPRHAHELLTPWKGVVTLQETEPDSRIQERKEHFRQSVTWENQVYFIDVVDEKGQEMGFSREQEWIAQYVNEPPPSQTSNSFTSAGDYQPGVYVYHGSVPKAVQKSVPCVEIYTSCELKANQEIYFMYHRTTRDDVYPVGKEFVDTRRRMYFHLPGILRRWLSDQEHGEENQARLSDFLQSRIRQKHQDDFYWRNFYTPGPTSHVFKKS